jgi:uncharacterized SAM-binding protein YcdF (DUF218 family)
MVALTPLQLWAQIRLARDSGRITRRKEHSSGTVWMARVIFFGLVIALAAFVGGFIAFAMDATTVQEAPARKADAIVVVTGGEDRIPVALGLLRNGSGKRLLISGVNPRTSASAIRDHTGEDRRLFECCVDIGREASDTVGNAEEARDWATPRGYRSLVVVTSAYHMPRTLAEFARAMPDVEFVAHPVYSRNVRDHVWWQSPATLRLLAGEYAKFVAAAARLGLTRAHALFATRRHEAVTTSR